MAESTLTVIFKGVDKGLSGTARGIGGSFSKLGGLVTAGAVAGGAALVGLGAAAIKLASDAESIVGVQSAFTNFADQTVLGSDKMLASLQEAGGGFVTNTDLMTSFNKAAQLVGIQFAERLPGAMDAVNKVASATGQDVGFLMDSLVTGIGRLSPMILDNLGIQVDLTQAYEDYAGSLGKTASELTKTEQQTALMNQVMEKLSANTDGMAGPQGSVQQLGVMFQNLKDTIGLQLLPVIQPLFTAFIGLAQQALPVIIDKVGIFLPILGNLVEGLLSGEDVLGDISNFVFEMALALGFTQEEATGLFFAVQDLWGRLVVFKDAVVEFLTPLKDWILQFVSAKDIMIAVGIVIGGVVLSALVSLLSAIGPIILAAGALIAIVSLLRNVWESDWQGIRTAVTDAWNNHLQPAIADLTDWFNNKLMPALSDLWDFIQANVIPILQALGDLIATYIIFQIEFTVGVIKLLWQELQVLWGWINDNIIPVLQALGEKIGNFLAPILDPIIDKFNTWREGIGGISNAVQSLIGWIGSLVDRLNSIEIPGALLPGSPTPFELGLRGISGAMQDLTRRDLPAFNMALNGGGGTSNSRTTNNNVTFNVNTSRFDAGSEGRGALAMLGGI